MTNNDQVSQEYLLVKCFLYKYTPEFTAVKVDPTASSDFALATFNPYSIELDETQYFTKYDISPYVTSYSFDQSIDETTFTWSVELMDQVLSYSNIDKMKVKPLSGGNTAGLSFSSSTDSVKLLSQYETNANTFQNNTATPNEANPVNPILTAKTERGYNAVTGTTGLRLSDLIQEYDFISLFLYKNTTPLTDIFGTFVPDPSSPPNNPLQVFNYKFTTDNTQAFQQFQNPQIAPLQNPADPYLQYETVLLTKLPTGGTLFSNEFNGFVMKKSITSAIGQVDRVTVTGNGWSRLFGATRRLMKSSLFQNSLYQEGQVMGFQDMSAFQLVYAGRPIAEIIRDLFDLVYRINFDVSYKTVLTPSIPLEDTNPQNSTNLVTSTQKESDFFVSPLGITGPRAAFNASFNEPNFTPAPTVGTLISKVSTLQLMLQNSFYNLTSLIVANSYPANLFNMPQFLLACVMKRRPFAYIEPPTLPVPDLFINTAIAVAAQETAVADTEGNNPVIGPTTLASAQEIQTSQTNPRAVKVPPETFQTAMQSLVQTKEYQFTQPVFFEPELQNLTAYFQFLADIFKDFSPELQTPYEILNTIRRNTFVEIFEQPNGQFVIRSPQYNNMTRAIPGRSDIGMVRSRQLKIITSTYTETVENLVSKVFSDYSPNIVPISVLQKFGYCDGKLLIQTGLNEMTTDANPNTTTASLSNNNANNSKTTSIFGYCEYLLALANARLKTGVIVCDLDNTVQVGQTYIDEKNRKFGYIVGISKHISIAGTATMTLNLSYVRDATPTYGNPNNYDAITNINMDLLPVLTSIEESFASGSQHV